MRASCLRAPLPSRPAIASAIALSIALGLAGCTSQMPMAPSAPPSSSASSPSAAAPTTFAPALSASETPAAVRHPLDQSLFLEAAGNGVQVYECMSMPAGPGWALKGPEATLYDRSGSVIGKHYAGPTWESMDGSSVTGEVRAQDTGPTPSAVPWLLLAVKSTSGAGVLTQTKSIQRVSTVGGVAPTEPCDTGRVGQLRRVPYQATYNFYRVSR